MRPTSTIPTGNAACSRRGPASARPVRRTGPIGVIWRTAPPGPVPTTARYGLVTISAALLTRSGHRDLHWTCIRGSIHVTYPRVRCTASATQWETRERTVRAGIGRAMRAPFWLNPEWGWDDFDPHVPDTAPMVLVFEEDPADDEGLVDVNGEPLFTEAPPFGFCSQRDA